MNRLRRGLTTVSAIALAVAATQQLTVSSRAGGTADTVMSLEDALAQDLGLIADANGWTIEEAWAYHRAEEAIEQIAVKVAAEQPDAFVGSALSLEPTGAPTIFIKGQADKRINDLVDAAGIEIIVADNQPFSFAELEDRKLRVHHSLQAQGFRFVVTGVNIVGGGVIEASVTAEPGLRATVDDVISLLPADLKSSTVLTISNAPVVVDEGAYGGMWLLDNGVNECTSGWTVTRIGTGLTGITSAGHCSGIDQINHPAHGLHATTFQSEHRGQWGDVEWYTTLETETDDFFCDLDCLRDVSAVEPVAGIAVNELICAFGRASADLHCSLRVQNPSMACGVVNRLVQMNGDTQIGGDSGGPWFLGGTAYGGHYGNCNGRDSFSVADLFDSAIGVVVRTF